MKLTIIFKEIEFDVEFDYQPEEKPDYTIRGYSLGYPGCAAQIEGIYKVEHKGMDFAPFLDETVEDWEKEMESAIWSALSDN